MGNDTADIKVSVWINEERMAALEKAGMADLAEEEFAGMKRLSITMTEEQKDDLLSRYPAAKYDSSTTRSVELLPKQVKDKLLALSMRMRSTGPDVLERFLQDA
ncbi:hypothetical protein [Mycobacterium sp.]|uniref:DUF6955 family protein n=1 Tax=Mycobacterium sp. TaxID=1785 RepID=UPI00127E7303|nr:hypothetical protein [Mycobacterium sp.]KAA8964254.1 MAG: hypothetical protein F6Q13_10195 [Mycobacterium sp.]